MHVITLNIMCLGSSDLVSQVPWSDAEQQLTELPGQCCSMMFHERYHCQSSDQVRGCPCWGMGSENVLGETCSMSIHCANWILQKSVCNLCAIAAMQSMHIYRMTSHHQLQPQSWLFMTYPLTPWLKRLLVCHPPFHYPACYYIQGLWTFIPDSELQCF